MKKQDIKIGQYVAASDRADAQIYMITGEAYPRVDIQWYEGRERCGQSCDASILQPASKVQLEFSERAGRQSITESELQTAPRWLNAG